ncbi:MAG: RNA-binding S4 domain-containing protein [Oscillospiraceae bacterium]|jgi:ribosomal 50S subunit-recycling heat shock protein|nr:RNA-binding S4 domain-containing protein [Oscillospiraceae bacterium]
MRLDKYLKLSRIVKRRSIANELCSAGKVSVNGKNAKASHEVKVGDILGLKITGTEKQFRIIKISEHVPKDVSASLFEVINPA